MPPRAARADPTPHGSLAPSARRTPRSGRARSRPAAAVVVAPQRPPRLARLLAEAGVARAAARPQGVLLHVEAPLHVGRARPERAEARAGLGGHHRAPQVRARARLVLERHEEVVVHLRPRPHRAHLRVHRPRRAEQHRAPGRSRAAPRSNSTPPASSGVPPSRHLPWSTSGRHRSKRDSSRRSSPSSPSVPQPRAGSGSRRPSGGCGTRSRRPRSRTPRSASSRPSSELTASGLSITTWRPASMAASPSEA